MQRLSGFLTANTKTVAHRPLSLGAELIYRASTRPIARALDVALLGDERFHLPRTLFAIRLRLVAVDDPVVLIGVADRA